MATATATTSSPTPPADRPMTAEEFLAQYGHCSGVELVRGRVVWAGRPALQTAGGFVMPKFRHGLVCSTADRLIGDFVQAHDLGRVATNDTFVTVTRDPDTTRGADILFVSYSRLPKGSPPEDLPVSPELVIEVRSPSDTNPEVLNKVSEYLAAGVTAVVVLNPKVQTATVHRAADEFPLTLHSEDELTLPDILPGFGVPVKRFFEA